MKLSYKEAVELAIELEALGCERDGMKAENAIREHRGEVMAYDEAAFSKLAERIRALLPKTEEPKPEGAMRQVLRLFCESCPREGKKAPEKYCGDCCATKAVSEYAALIEDLECWQDEAEGQCEQRCKLLKENGEAEAIIKHLVDSQSIKDRDLIAMHKWLKARRSEG